MKRKISESQMVAAIKKQEAGIAVKEICRELGVSKVPRFTIGKQSTEAWKSVMW